jgi:hypothetical protein
MLNGYRVQNQWFTSLYAACTFFISLVVIKYMVIATGPQVLQDIELQTTAKIYCCLVFYHRSLTAFRENFVFVLQTFSEQAGPRAGNISRMKVNSISITWVTANNIYLVQIHIIGCIRKVYKTFSDSYAYKNDWFVHHLWSINLAA